MRHGPAEDAGPGRLDVHRKLTDAGRLVVRTTAERFLAARGEPVPRILASPRVRARETAEIMWRTAGRPSRPVEIEDALDADEATPTEFALAIGAGLEDALLVGHNPNVEELVR